MKILKIILLVINSVCLLLMLGSTMAGAVVPSKFIGFSLLSYGYLYFLIANVIFVVLWLILSSKWFLLSLLGILVRYSFLPLYFQVGGTESFTDSDSSQFREMKVMTFNTHFFAGAGWNNDTVKVNKDENVLEFLRIVDEEMPDVIAMQEFREKGDTMKLTKYMVERGYIYAATGRDNGAVSGEVLFSKAPIINMKRIDTSSKIYANIKWGKDTVRVYCIHLASYGLDKKDHSQLQDITHGNMDNDKGRSTFHKFRSAICSHEKEWEVLKEYFEEKGDKTIVAGDFNDTPASYFYQQCTKLLVDSYCEAGQGFSTTYHGTFTQKRAMTFPSFRIDMILHSPDIKALSYKRIKSDVSDHYPVIVTLKIND